MSGVVELTDDEVFGTAAAAPREMSDDEVFGAPSAPLPPPPPAPMGEVDTRRDRSAYTPLGSSPPPAPIRAPADRALLIDQSTVAPEDRIGPISSLTTPQPTMAQEVGQNIAELGKGIPRGVGTLIGGALRGMGATAQGGLRDMIPVFDRIDRGETVPDMEDPVGYSYLSPEQRQQVRAGLTPLANRPISSLPLVQAGQAVEAVSDIFPAKPGYEQSIGRELGEGLGSMVGGALIPGGPVVRAATFAFSGAGEATERAIRDGATENQIVTAARAGILPGMTDSLPVETLTGRIPVPGFGYIRIPPGMMGAALRGIGRIGWTAFEEGMQEGGQQFLQNLIAREVYKPLQPLGEDVLHNIGIGGGVGGIAQTGAEGLRLIRRRGPSGSRPPPQEILDGIPPPPEPQIAPVVPAPTPPPGGPPVASFPPVPGAGAAPPVSSVPPIIDGQGGAGQQPSPQTVTPIAAPPAPPVLTEAEKAASDLEKVMSDPRTNAEIAAEKQAAETALIESVPAALPPGFTMAPDPDSGGFMVLDPAGDLIGRLDPGGVSENRISKMLEAAQHLANTVDYSDYTRVGDGTRGNPVVVQQPTDIHAAGTNVNTDATDEQKKAGVYEKGHIRLHGLDIAIENPAGSTRSGVDPSGQPWSTEMPYDYGYIKRTRGADGDQVDVLLGPQAHEAPRHPVWVVDQRDPDTGAFDEHKALIGFPTRGAAEIAYHEGFSDGSGPARAGTWNEMGFPQFQRWVKAGPRKEAISYEDPRPAAKDAVQGAANGAGLRLQPDEASAAADLVVQGHPPADAVMAVVEAAAIAAEEKASFQAPAGYDVARAELEFWAQQLGLTLTPAQMADAFALTMQGHLPPQAVMYAGAVQPAIEAEAEAAAALQTEQEIADATRRDEPGAEVPRPGEPVADQGGQPAEPERRPTPEPAPDSEQPPASGAEFPAVAPRPEPVGSAADTERPEPAPTVGEPEPDEVRDGEPEAAGGTAAAETGQADLDKPADVGTIDAPNLIGLAHGFRDAFLANRAFKTIVQARALAGEWLGGKIQPGTAAAKLTDEAIELGAVLAARQIVADDPPPIPAGSVRFYHGGNPESVGGALWFTTNLADAEGWASRGSAMRVWYVDVPRGAKNVDWGDIDNGIVMPSRQELTASLAADRRPLRADPAEAFDRLLHLYDVQQPRLGVRTGSSVERQAYSTPLPLAYAVSRLGGAGTARAAVYEPTAGNGALLLEVRPPTRALANELDPERRAALKEQGFVVRDNDATTFEPAHQVSVVLANPPFGVVRGDNGQNARFDMSFIQNGYTTTQIDHAIALRAVERMYDDGRAVFILGGIDKQVRDPARRADVYNGKMKREFFFTLYGKYNVVDHFTVPGELYAGQGAAWPVDVIVIHGRGKSSLPLPSIQAPRIVAGWPEIKEIMLNAQPLALYDEPASRVEPGPGEQRPAGGPAAGGGQDADKPDVSGPPPRETGMDAGTGNGAAGSGIGISEQSGGAGNVERPDAVREPAGSGAQSFGGERPLAEPPTEPSAPAGSGTVSGGQPTASNRSDQTNSGGRVGEPGGTVREGQDGTRVEENIAEDLTAPAPETADQAPPTSEPAPKKKQDIPTSSQVAYRPKSKAPPVGTLNPVNIDTATQAALDRLVADFEPGHNGAPPPTVDEWVADKLDYTKAEILKRFSAEQVDALGLAIKQVDAGLGFIIGDMTGVGKGRVVAGMIRYALIKGLTPIFATAMPTLYADMARDLKDIGMSDLLPQILITNNNTKIPLTDDPKGPRIESGDIGTHEPILAEAARQGKLPDGYRVLFTTYYQMQQAKGQITTRMRLLRSLAPNAFLIMDESHNAGGSGVVDPTKLGDKMPRSVFARELVRNSKSVFYSSATWAKRPDVMDLYGLKTNMALAVAKLDDLAPVIAAGGVPMQQIVTAQLAQDGQYIRRERSFEGVPYDLTETPVDKATYDRVAGVLADIFAISERFVRPAIKNISQNLKEAASAVSPDGSTGGAGAASTSFGSVMHNLISQMLLASKAKGAVERAIVNMKADKKVVITVANTMGSFIEEFTTDVGASPGDEIDLSFNSLLKRYLARTLRYVEKKPFSREKGTPKWLKPGDLGPTGAALYHATMRKIAALDLSEFPVSPIDYMHARLQEAGFKGGELTGRSEAAEYKNGKVYYRRRPGKERSDAGKIAVVRGFNGGSVDYLIINQSGATGLSMHASETFKDQRQRVMLIAQAESNIDIFMQMLGRIFRNGEVVKPAYEQLVADIPAEKRPAAVLSMKMASLSAATTASRSGSINSKAAIDVINRYGGAVMERMLNDDHELAMLLGDPLGSGDDTDMDPTEIARKVTGRIPLLRLKPQEEIWDEIERRYKMVIEEMDAAGTNALEAKTLDLDAKELERHAIFEGHGNSPFTASADAVLYSIKRQNKPPTSKDVAFSIWVNYGTGTSPEVTTSAEAASYVTGRLERDGAEYARSKIADLKAGVNAARARTEEIDADKRPEAVAKIDDAEAHIRAVLDMARPGNIVELDDGAGKSLAMVYHVYRGQKANPAARSSWDVSFFDQSGRRRVVPISQLFPPQIAPANDSLIEHGFRVISPVAAPNHHDFLVELEERAKHTREERWIVTGNIMAGFAATKGSGQILNFSDHEGVIRQGIQMPDRWSAAAHLREAGTRMTAAQATAFLSSGGVVPDESPRFVTASNDAFRITATNDKILFFMDVVSARSEGGKYYMANDLRQHMRYRDFFGRGGAMRGRFDSRDLPAVLEAAASILKDDQGTIVSKHPAAASWMAEQAAAPRTDRQALTAGEINDPRLTWNDAERPIRADAFAVLSETVQAMTGYRTKIVPVKGPLRERETGEEALALQAGGKLIVIGIRGSVATGWALHHEAVHALRVYDLIQPAEWNVLTRAAERENWGTQYAINVRYPNLEREERQEEAVAEAFGEYSQRRRPVPKGMIGRAFRRTTTFFSRLKSGLAGKGFTRPEDVFERIISGEVGKREGSPVPGRAGTMEEAQYAVASQFFWDQTKSPFVEERPDDLAVRNPDGTLAIDLMAGMSEPLKRMMREAAAPARRQVNRWLDAFYGRPGTDQIIIEEPRTAKDFGLGRFLGNPVMIPRQLFGGDPALARMVQRGIEAEEALSRWNQELTQDYERIGKTLNRAGGSFANVQTALVLGDAEEIDVTDEAELAELFAATSLDAAERAAFREYTKLLEKVARFIDQHRRSMEPKVRAEKARVWQRMHLLLTSARIAGNADFTKLYNRRRYLTGQVRDGKGDLDVHAKEIDAINDQLRRFRLADPELQGRLNDLQDEYDSLEARLQAVQVRGRRKGYVPHRFFGSWRLHVLEPETDEANSQWREITSDQGFYSTRTDAIAAAKKYLAEHPDAQLRIQPRAPDWPPGLEGTELSDRAYMKLRNEIEEATGLQGEELNDAMKGVARRRFRRRILSAARYRTGKTGYSQDMDKVMRTHIGAAVRYIVFDRLKFQYVNAIERAGLSRNRGATVQDRPQMQKAIEAWWRDVNGAKQPMEGYIDNILRNAGMPAAVMTAGAVAALAGFGAGLGVIWTPMLASYAGWRMYRALKNGGDFPFRTLTGGIVSDMAHFKLGMITNIHSGVVNLTQTMLNTYPVLGAKYTTIGIKRATAALWDQARGKETQDAVLLRRAGVRTQFHLSDAQHIGASSETLAARLSMLGFNTTETFNRAVAFLGAYAQQQDAGASPGQAMRQAQSIMRRTQFHYGNADKPMLLRQQWARVPLQFKNYMLHQIGLVFSLRRAEIPRFLGALYVATGLLGLPALQGADWLYKFATGNSLTTEIRYAVVEAAKNGQAAGNVALAMAYGLPGYLGSSVAASVGMGDRFIPTNPKDLAGPTIGTIATLGQAVKKGAGLTDQLRAISPSFAWLKALETAANGNQITSGAFWDAANWQKHTLTDWRHRGAAIYHPDVPQIIAQGLGFTPIEQTVRQAEFVRLLEKKQSEQGKADAYLARIVEARRRGTPSDIPAILREARAAKVHISPEMVQNANRAAQKDITVRGVHQAPLLERPSANRGRRALDSLFE